MENTGKDLNAGPRIAVRGDGQNGEEPARPGGLLHETEKDHSQSAGNIARAEEKSRKKDLTAENAECAEKISGGDCHAALAMTGADLTPRGEGKENLDSRLRGNDETIRDRVARELNEGKAENFDWIVEALRMTDAEALRELGGLDS